MYAKRRNLQIAFVILDDAMFHMSDEDETFSVLYSLQQEVVKELFDIVKDSRACFHTLLEQMNEDHTPGLKRLTREQCVTWPLSPEVD